MRRTCRSRYITCCLYTYVVPLLLPGDGGQGMPWNSAGRLRVHRHQVKVTVHASQAVGGVGVSQQLAVLETGDVESRLIFEVQR